jgi:hypothetical protein
MRGGVANLMVWILLLVAVSCAKPAQSGGLGVFNPRGLEGRLALANRVNGSTTTEGQPQRPAAVATPTAAPSR